MAPVWLPRRTLPFLPVPVASLNLQVLPCVVPRVPCDRWVVGLQPGPGAWCQWASLAGYSVVGWLARGLCRQCRRCHGRRVPVPSPASILRRHRRPQLVRGCCWLASCWRCQCDAKAAASGPMQLDWSSLWDRRCRPGYRRGNDRHSQCQWSNAKPSQLESRQVRFAPSRPVPALPTGLPGNSSL
jgi:hypothetical protein